MKIAVPLDENRQDISIVLARAPYFLFREGEHCTIVENPGAQALSGAGIQAAQFLVDAGVQALLTVRCGENSAQVLRAAEIKIYKATHTKAQQELEAFAEGKSEELTQFHGGFHGTL